MSIDSQSNLERLRDLLRRRKGLKEESPSEPSIIEELGIKTPPKEKKSKCKEHHRQNGGRRINPKR